MNGNRRALALMGLVFLVSSGAEAAELASSDRKPRPSEFNIGDLNELMMQAVSNSSNQVKFATPPGEYIVYGRVLDDRGKPVLGAHVLLSDDSNGRDLYLANFDVTDALGRFVVQAAPSSRVIYVRTGDQYCKLRTGGAEDVIVQAPKTFPVQFRQSQVELIDEHLWVEAKTDRVGVAVPFGDLRTTVSEARSGKFFLAPGTYLVYGSRRVETKTEPVRGRIELAEINVLPEPSSQEFSLGRTGGAKITGVFRDYASLMAKPNVIGVKLSLSVFQTQSNSGWRTIDTITCGEDGKFLFEAIPPGSYLLIATNILDLKVVNRQFRFGALPGGGNLFKERIDVAEADVHLSLPSVRDVDSTANQVHRILDSEHPQPNVSWSWSDVQISQLAMIKDRDGMVGELLRLLKADDTPASWRYLIIESLWRIRPLSAGTKAALVNAIKDPVNARWRGSLLRTLRNMAGEAFEMVDLIISLREDEDWQVRYGVADAMGEIGKSRITPPDRMVDAAIALLDDPHGLVRKQAAGSLGELRSPRAIEALQKRMQDPYGPARAMAAWALFECSGEIEPSLSAMIHLLETADHEARREAAIYLGMFDHRAAGALSALQANTNYRKNPPFSSTRETVRYQLRNAAERAMETIEDAIGWQAEAEPFALRLDATQRASVNMLQFDAAWGEPIDGLQLGILIGGNEVGFGRGERIPITLLVRNASENPIRFEIDRRLHDIGPVMTDGDGKPHRAKNARILVSEDIPVATLPPGGVVSIPHSGLGLGENPEPMRRLWHPYVTTFQAGRHQVSQRYRFEVHNPMKGSKKRIWLTSGNAEVTLL